MSMHKNMHLCIHQHDSGKELPRNSSVSESSSKYSEGILQEVNPSACFQRGILRGNDSRGAITHPYQVLTAFVSMEEYFLSGKPKPDRGIIYNRVKPDCFQRWQVNLLARRPATSQMSKCAEWSTVTLYRTNPTWWRKSWSRTPTLAGIPKNGMYLCFNEWKQPKLQIGREPTRSESCLHWQANHRQ